MPRPIIIDTDPGIDDAVAIMLALASPELEVRGLVAVAGNVPLQATSRNAGAVLELAGRADIPVYAGCPRPLGGGRVDAARVHGTSGLGDLLLPDPVTPAQSQHGVAWLIDTLRAAPPGSMTVCALGPLTNVATALVMAPDIAAGIAELVVMGGGTRGNITPAAEFNIHCDPVAAEIVFTSGIRPITLVPLDVTTMTSSAPGRVDALRRIGTRCAAAAADLLTPSGGWPGRVPVSIHDACVIAYLVEPALFHACDANVRIETQSPLTSGMTVIDTLGRTGRPNNARVLDAIQPDGLYRLLGERLGSLP